MKQLFSIISNLRTHYHFENDLQTVHQHTVGKWLIHDTKHRQESSCKIWNSPVEYLSRLSKHDIKESEGNMFNPIFKRNFISFVTSIKTCI